jgi:hypothetical protein
MILTRFPFLATLVILTSCQNQDSYNNGYYYDPQQQQKMLLIGLLAIAVIIIVVLIKKNNSKQAENNGGNNILGWLFPPIFGDKLDIFIYGHSASGKSTFIQRLFTIGTNELKSTVDFDYYEYDRPEDVGGKRKVKIRIADYRGQNPAQILEQIKKNTSIDCLLYMVDIAPAYSSSMKKYRDEEVIGVMAKDVEKSILDRVKEHDEYMSKFLLKIVFEYSMNPKLKSVYFLINKIDVLEKLQGLGIIDKEVDIEEYAKSFFMSRIEEVNKFCVQNNIVDFQTYCISTVQHKNIHTILSNIVSTYNSKK